MRGGAGARVVHGSVAAAAVAVLAAAAATVDIPDKLHLKATPVLFYAVPVSMPLPPLSSLAGPFGCVDSTPTPFSVWFPRILPAKDSATPPLASASSLAPPCAFVGSGRADSSSACPPYASSPFPLAQGASGVSSLSTSSRRALSHLFPVYLATSVVPQVAASHSALYPGATVATPPSLMPFYFSTLGLYSAPVTEKLVSGGFPSWRQFGNSLYTEAKLSGNIAQAQSLVYLESLLSALPSFQSSAPNISSPPSQSLHTWHAPRGRYPRDDNHDAQDSGVRKPALTVVLLGWLGAQQKHLKKYAEWYNARGIHAVTFVIPMADVLSFKVEQNADEHVDALSRHLVQWLSDQGEHEHVEGEKQLMFHIFSNTGWLTYVSYYLDRSFS